MKTILEMGKAARDASRFLMNASTEQKNSFLMKRRRSEYGLYNVLGMEKRHVIHVLFFESLFTSLLSVLLGLCFGMLFYKLSSLLICRISSAAFKTPSIGFT